jgi:hypothetical protein
MSERLNKQFRKTVTMAAVIALTFTAVVPANAAILFQEDDFTTVNSQNLVIDNYNNNAGNVVVQFGKTLNKTLLYSQTNSRFEFNANVDLNGNQLSTALIENVSALPGGAGGLGTSAKGRIVQLTATDGIAPGCTSPTCAAGTYSWDGSTWHALQGSVTTSTATKIVTVGPTGRDYTTLAAAATYCNTLSGCEMWIDPGTYPVTTSVDLSNTKLYGADGGGITQISVTGSGQLLVKDTFFYELNIGVATATPGINVVYNATSSSSALFSKVIFSTAASGEYVFGSTAGTPPTTIINLVNCAEAHNDPGAFINTQALSGLNTGTSLISVINLLTKDPLKISNWPVTIVGGSNVVTTGTITSVPDRTIMVSPDMDANDAITSLGATGGVVELLVGTHNITSPILVNSSNIALIGEGPGTIINVPSAGWTGGTSGTAAAVEVGAIDGTAPVNNVIVRDLTVQVQPDIHGIKVNGGKENKVTDTVVTSTGTKSSTHTAIVFTDSTAAAGVRMTASRNIVNRDDSLATPSCATGGNHCWVDGFHFDGEGGFSGQLFGYGNSLNDSIISENIVNEVQQTSYDFSDVGASGIFSNRSRNIGFNTGATPFGLFVNDSNDVSVINNTIETNNYASTIGIELYNSVESSTIIGNTIDSGGVANYAIAIDFRAGSTASNHNIVTSNEIVGATTGIYIGAGHSENIISSNKYVNTTTYVTDAGTNTKLETLHHEDTANPTASNDITQDYRTGTMWVNTATNATFVCTNSTAGAAVWTAVSGPFHTQNTDTGTNQTTFTLNNGNTNVNTTLAFGGSSPQTLTWNPTTINFNLSSALSVTGNLSDTGNFTDSGSALIGTTGTANTKLDVNGDLALRSNTITLVNGANNNVAIGGYSDIRIAGPTAAFNITGLAAGVNGKVVTLLNTTTSSFTVSNLNGSSTAANQIVTGTGADLAVAGSDSVSLIYDSTSSHWVVTGYNGITPVTNGGTGLSSGTSGGILSFTAPGIITSSGALGANQLVLGGGAGAAPSTPVSLGTTTTVLHGNAAGAPSFGAVALGTDVSGTLPLANGGTNATSASGARTSLGAAASGANSDITSLSGLTTALSVAQGGTGDTLLTAYAPLFGGTTSTGPIQSGTLGSSGQVLMSNGAGALPTFQYSAALFGDGNDGDVIISSNTTLTHDMNYHNLTVNSGDALSTAGYRVYISGTLTIQSTGSINDDGGAGGNGQTGATGGGGTAGTAVSRTPNAPPSTAGGAGGGGGTATSTTAGTGGAAPTDILSSPSLFPYTFLSGCGGGGGGGKGTAAGNGTAGVNCLAGALGGAGGTANGTSGRASGGGGGAGGGVLYLYVNAINSSGTISANGGAGGAGGTNAGGGGGGGGGAVIIYYATATAFGTVTANGGAAGTGTAAGNAGANGTVVETQI